MVRRSPVWTTSVVGVDRGNDHLLAGDDAGGGDGGESDDLVPGGVAPSTGGGEFGAGEPSGLLAMIAGEPVEVGDVLAPPGQQGGPVPSAGVVGPCVGHGDEGVGPVRGGVDAVVLHVPLDGVGHGAVAELGQSGAFGGVGLADVLIQHSDQFRSLFEQGVQGTTGSDG